jgi:hypothetical protein
LPDPLDLAYDTDDRAPGGDDGADGRRHSGTGTSGCSTPIHEGNTICRAVAVGGFLVMRVGMIFWWLRAARQDQLGVRRARPVRSSPPWRRSAGVTLLLIARRCLSWPAGVPLNLGRPSTGSERGFGRDLAYFPNLPSRRQFRAASTRSKSALLHRPRRNGNSERVACHESWRRIRSPRHRHNP